MSSKYIDKLLTTSNTNEKNEILTSSYIENESKFSHAISINKLLTIQFNSHETIEIDFDDEISCLSWSPKNMEYHLLLVGDSTGCIYFISSKGVILFKYNLLKENCRVVGMKFFKLENILTLFINYENGTIIVIDNFPIKIIYNLAISNPQLLANSASKFVNRKLIIPNNFVKDIVINRKESQINIFNVIVLDDNKKLFCYDINNDNSMLSNNLVVNDILTNNITMFQSKVDKVISCGNLVTIQSEKNVVVYDMELCKSVSEFNLISKDCILESINKIDSSYSQLSGYLIVTKVLSKNPTLYNYFIPLQNNDILIVQPIELGVIDIINNINEVISTHSTLLSTYYICNCNDVTLCQLSNYYFKYLQSISIGYDVYLIEQRLNEYLQQITLPCQLEGLLVGIISKHSTLTDINTLNTNKLTEFIFEMIVKLTSYLEINNVFKFLLTLSDLSSHDIKRAISIIILSLSHLCGNLDLEDDDYYNFQLNIAFYNQLITAAEYIINNSTKHNSEKLETSLSNNPNEDMIRIIIYSLLPSNIYNTWLKYLSNGELSVSLYIYEKFTELIGYNYHILERLSYSDIIKSIPISKYVNVNLLIKFVSIVIDTINYKKIDEVYSIIQILYNYAYNLQLITNLPYDSHTIITYNIKILDRVCINDNNCNSYSIITASNRQYYSNLLLQLELWNKWNDQVTINDIQSLDLIGLIYDRLWSIDEMKLPNDIDIIESTYKNYHERYGNKCFDDVIYDWINHNLQTRIIQSASSKLNSSLNDSNDNALDHEFVSINRLIITTNCIRNPSIKVNTIIKLLQLTDTSINDSNNYIEKLLTMSNNILDQLPHDLRESIEECIQLKRLNQLAFSYGIVAFDNRNYKHIIQLLYTISCNVSHSKSISDVINILSNRNINNHVFISNIICKVIMNIIFDYPLHNILDGNFYLSNAYNSFKDIIMCNLNHVTVSNQIHIIEDLTIILLNHLEDNYSFNGISYLIDNKNGIVNKLDTNELKQSTIRIMQSMYIILLWYYDNNDVNSHNSSIVSIDDFNKIKRLLAIQSNLSIYLPISTLSNQDMCKQIIDEIANQNMTSTITLSNVIIPYSVVKICKYLDVPINYYGYKLIKLLISQSKYSLAVSTLKELSIFNSNNEDSNSLNCKYLIESINELCYHAAQEIMKTDSKSNNNTFSVFNKPLFQSNLIDRLLKDKPSEPFSLSKDILIDISITCESELLVECINIWGCLSIVLMIFDRIDSKSTSISNINDNIISVDMKLLNDKENIANYQLTKLADSNTGNIANAFDKKNQFVINTNYYNKDGILLSNKMILNPLLLFTFNEMKRRLNNSNNIKSIKDNNDDVIRLVDILLKNDNHMISIAILLSSWCNRSEAYHKILGSTIITLTKKLLNAHTIDEFYTIHCLTTLCNDEMIKELRSSIPSIQSDYSRLYKVSMIGEELARLWNQEQLLIIFQDLQINARWWHILSYYNIKVDIKSFQSSNIELRNETIRNVVIYIIKINKLIANNKSILMTMMSNNHIDISNISSYTLAVEYCRQYNIESDYPSICYLNELICDPDSFIDNTNQWKLQILDLLNNKMNVNMSINQMLFLYKKINSIEYDRIRFVLIWLVNTLDNEDIIGIANSAIIIQDCNKYLHLLDFLSNMYVPINMLLKCFSNSSNIISYYQSVSTISSYLPFWELIDQPWEIISKVLYSLIFNDVSDDLIHKLQLLCNPLGIDRDFYIIQKHIIKFQYIVHSLCFVSTNNLDINFNSLITSETFSSLNIIGAANEWNNEVDIIIEKLNDYLTISISENSINNYHCTEIFKIIYNNYKNNSSYIKLSMLCLDKIIQLNNTQTNDVTIYIQDYYIIKCYYEMTIYCPMLQLNLSSYLNNNPTVSATNLINYTYSITNDIIWAMQIDYRVLNSYSYICNSSILISNEVIQLSGNLVKLIDCFIYNEIYRQSIVNPNISKNDLKETVSKEIDSIKHNIISKYLIDNVYANNNFKSNNSSSNLTNSSDVENHLTTLSVIEGKHNEDIQLGYLIAFVIGTSSDDVKMITYIRQLESILHSNRSTMHRFTTRSQFRSVYAIFLLRNYFTNKELYDCIIDNRYQNTVLYYYCLSMINDIRLVCPDEIILSALGLDNSNALNSNNYTDLLISNTSNINTIVKTWLIDELNREDVINVCIDLIIIDFYLSNNLSNNKVIIINYLIDHLINKSKHRQLFVLISSLYNYCYDLYYRCSNIWLINKQFDVVQYCFNNLSNVYSANNINNDIIMNIQILSNILCHSNYIDNILSSNRLERYVDICVLYLTGSSSNDASIVHIGMNMYSYIINYLVANKSTQLIYQLQIYDKLITDTIDFITITYNYLSTKIINQSIIIDIFHTICDIEKISTNELIKLLDHVVNNDISKYQLLLEYYCKVICDDVTNNNLNYYIDIFLQWTIKRNNENLVLKDIIVDSFKNLDGKTKQKLAIYVNCHSKYVNELKKLFADSLVH